MTREELKNLNLNQRVKYKYLNRNWDVITEYGYVTKIYNGNWQIQVWFDGASKPRTLGYSRVEIIYHD